MRLSGKVLHVIASMDPKMGGVCQAVRAIISGVSKHGIENEVASLDALDAPYLLNDPFPIHALGPGKTPWNYSSRLFPWLIENFNNFDFVIVHGMWLYHSYAVGKAIKAYKDNQYLKDKETDTESANRKPSFIVMPHGMLDPYFQKSKERKLKALRNVIYWGLVEGNVINQADALFFTSEEERKLSHEPFSGYHPKNEVVVGLGVEEPPIYTTGMRDAFLQKCPGLANGSYFLFIGRINYKKGVDLLIEAYIKLLQSLQHNEEIQGAVTTSKSSVFENNQIPKLVIAGPGLDTAYGEKIAEMASASDILKENILFPGMLTGDAKWGAFYGCEAFVLPSHQENFGIAVVEALGCGRPVLISDKVNIWREIEDNHGGLVAEDTVDGMYSLFEKWEDLKPEEQQEMAQGAKKTYENNYAIEAAAVRFVQALYKQAYNLGKFEEVVH